MLTVVMSEEGEETPFPFHPLKRYPSEGEAEIMALVPCWKLPDPDILPPDPEAKKRL